MLGHSVQHRGVRGRVELVDPAGEHGDRRSVGGHRDPVRDGVDAVCSPGDDDTAGIGGGGGDLCGGLGTEDRVRPRTDDRDGRTSGGARCSASPEDQRRVWAEVVDPRGPVLVAGHDEGAPDR